MVSIPVNNTNIIPNNYGSSSLGNNFPVSIGSNPLTGINKLVNGVTNIFYSNSVTYYYQS